MNSSLLFLILGIIGSIITYFIHGAYGRILIRIKLRQVPPDEGMHLALLEMILALASGCGILFGLLGLTHFNQ